MNMIFEKTKIYKLTNSTLSPEEINELRNILKAGHLIVFPTETVYGLGCLYGNEAARAQIFELKKRELQKKLPVMVSDDGMIESYFKCDCPPLAKKIIRKFMPGPVTVVLKCRKEEEGLGFRIPDNKFVMDLIGACKEPLAVTSANLSDEKPAVDFETAYKIFANKVEAIVDGGRCKISKSSTVIDLRNDNNMRIIREGAYNESLIKTALSLPKNILFICTGNSCRSILATAVFKKELENFEVSDIKVSSAGTAAFEGMPPTEETLKVLEEDGIGGVEDKAKRLTVKMLEDADLILAMENRHIDYILNQGEKFGYKIFGFLEFAFGLEEGVADPIGRGIEEYRKTLAIIKGAVKRIVKKIV